SDIYFFSRRVQLATLAAHYRIPAAYSVREAVEAGGLMSYGADRADVSRQVGVYTRQILKGAKPADPPVLQLSKFEFVIKPQTARLLGIEVPNALQLLADEVIEGREARGRLKNETSPPTISTSGRGCCRAAGRLARGMGASLPDAASDNGG